MKKTSRKQVEHQRQYKSGKVSLVNKGIKKRKKINYGQIYLSKKPSRNFLFVKPSDPKKIFIGKSDHDITTPQLSEAIGHEELHKALLDTQGLKTTQGLDLITVPPVSSGTEIINPKTAFNILPASQVVPSVEREIGNFHPKMIKLKNRKTELEKRQRKSYNSFADRRLGGVIYDPYTQLNSLAAAQEELDKEGQKVFYTSGQEQKLIRSLRSRGIKIPGDVTLPNLVKQYRAGDYDVMEELNQRKFLPFFSK